MSNSWSPYAATYDPIKIGSIDGTDTYPHDRGIVRALAADFRPNRTKVKDPKLTLFVSKLDESVTEKDLEQLFKRHGDVKSITLVRDIVTGFSKHYGFVEFEDARECKRAKRETHKTVLKGKEILVDHECQQTISGWVPRRLGGGFGGRKESGQLRFGCLDRPWKMPIGLQFSDIHHNDKNKQESRSYSEYSSNSRHKSSNDRSKRESTSHSERSSNHQRERRHRSRHEEESSSKRRK